MKSSILPIAFLAAARANPILSREDHGIKWSSCEIANSTMPMECAVIQVPLDYTDKTSIKSINLDLQRVKAKGKSRRSILVNFGGPGESGKLELGLFGKILHTVTGGQHDIVNFVPRGTAGDLAFSCFDDPVSRGLANAALSGDANDVARGQLWAQSAIFDNACYTKQNKTGSLIGTAFVARDVMQIVDQLQEDGKLRYWGFSYGTLLGSTLLAMFPDKVDKIILDGVVNPANYYENTENDIFSQTEDVFAGFCKGCAETPESCPLAKNRTATEVRDYILKNLEYLRQNPFPAIVPGVNPSAVVDYSTTKALMVSNFYAPQTWPQMSKQLQALFDRDAVALISALVGDGSGGGGGKAKETSTGPESTFGIKCSDVRHHVDSLDDIAPVLDARQNSSYFAPVSDQFPLRCAQWPMQAKEIYQGDFKTKPAKPVLVIANSFDPVTPKIGALNVTANLEGSVLLEQEGYGHSTLAQASLCTAKVVKQYFQQGKVPKVGTKCPVDVPLFTDSDGWDKALQKLGC